MLDFSALIITLLDFVIMFIAALIAVHGFFAGRLENVVFGIVVMGFMRVVMNTWLKDD